MSDTIACKSFIDCCRYWRDPRADYKGVPSEDLLQVFKTLSFLKIHRGSDARTKEGKCFRRAEAAVTAEILSRMTTPSPTPPA